MNTMLMLVRREFWEHRSLWIAPLVWVGLIVIMSMWGTIATLQYQDAIMIGHYETVDAIPKLNDAERAMLAEQIAAPAERKETVYALAQLVLGAMISAVVLIVVFFYLIDSLYAERRDRSILFWKSMPVSDMQVVLSKLAVALVIMPLAVLALAAVTQILLSIIFWIRFDGTVLGQIIPAWSFKAWVVTIWAQLLFSLGAVLWYVPVAAYLLIMSSLSRRAVFLWVVLPPAALMLLEKIFLSSEHVTEFVGRRLVGFAEVLDVNSSHASHGEDHLPTLSEAYNAVNFSGLFLLPELWLGVVAGGAMIYATIRIRRHRDDT